MTGKTSSAVRGVVGLVLAGSLVLTGCGAAGGGNAGKGSSEGINEGLAAFLTEAAKPYQGVNLNVLTFPGPQAESIAEMTSEFTELTGIRVTYTTVAENEAITKTQVTLNSKSDGFDVIQYHSTFAKGYFQGSGFLPVSKLAANTAATYDGFNLDSYIQGAVDGFTFGGETYAVPMFLGTQLMYYRTDIFEEAGVDVPTTLDELEEVLAKIHGKPLPAFAARTAIGSVQNLLAWTTWLYNDGGGYYESYDAGASTYGGPRLNSSESVASAQRFSDVVNQFGPTGSLNWTVADVTQAFLTGQVAVIQEGNPFGATINDPEQSTVAGKVGAFPIPAGQHGAHASYVAHGWGVSSYSKNVEAAWLFTQWAADPATLRAATLDYSFSAPPVASILEDPEFVKKYDYTGFLSSLSETFSRPSSPIGGSFFPSLSNWSEVGQGVSTQLSELITGRLDAQTAMDNANKVLVDQAKD